MNRKHIKIFLFSLFAVFLLIRLINFAATFLLLDDFKALSGLSFVPWNNLLYHVLAYVLTGTRPIFQPIIVKILMNIFGADVFVLRLPALFISSLSFFLLFFTLYKLKKSFYFYAPALVVFTFSIPVIIYSRQIQASIYYFFASLCLIAFYVSLKKAYDKGINFEIIKNKLSIFAFIAVLMFIFSYISVVSYAILLIAFLVEFFAKLENRQKTIILKIISWLFIVNFPLLILIFLRVGHSMYLSPSIARPYLEAYYAKSLTDFFILFYETISYHLNFLYNQNLYHPGGINLFSLPFVFCVLLGIFSYLKGQTYRIITVFFTFLILLILNLLKLFPLGGLRHTLNFAPFVFIAFSYGVFEINNLVEKNKIKNSVLIIFIFLPVFIFAIFGHDMYSMRRTRVDFSKLILMAKKYNVKTFYAYEETYPMLFMRNHSEASPLNASGISLKPYTPDVNVNLNEAYILLANRYVFNYRKEFEGAFWSPYIPRRDFKNLNISTIEEDLGPIKPLTKFVQSIYYPINGFFIYLIKPL